MTWSGERLLLGGRGPGRGERWLLGERDQRLLLRAPHRYCEQDPLHAQLRSGEYSRIDEMVTCEPKCGKHQSLAHVVCFRSMCITSRTEENTRWPISSRFIINIKANNIFRSNIVCLTVNIRVNQLPRPNRPHSQYDHGCRPNTYPPRIEKSDRHYGVANGDDLTYLFPVLQVVINVYSQKKRIMETLNWCSIMNSLDLHQKEL